MKSAAKNINQQTSTTKKPRCQHNNTTTSQVHDFCTADVPPPCGHKAARQQVTKTTYKANPNIFFHPLMGDTRKPYATIKKDRVGMTSRTGYIHHPPEDNNSPYLAIFFPFLIYSPRSGSALNLRP